MILAHRKFVYDRLRVLCVNVVGEPGSTLSNWPGQAEAWCPVPNAQTFLIFQPWEEVGSQVTNLVITGIRFQGQDPDWALAIFGRQVPEFSSKERIDSTLPTLKTSRQWIVDGKSIQSVKYLFLGAPIHMDTANRILHRPWHEPHHVA